MKRMFNNWVEDDGLDYVLFACASTFLTVCIGFAILFIIITNTLL